MYLARGINSHDSKREDLVDCLPDSLEYLCIRGYRRGRNKKHDARLDRLLKAQKAGTSKLKGIEGIGKYIRQGKHARYLDPDDHDPVSLWKLPKPRSEGDSEYDSEYNSEEDSSDWDDDDTGYTLPFFFLELSKPIHSNRGE